MLVSIRLFTFIFCLTFLSLTSTSGAQGNDRTWEQKHEDGLSASRLSVSIASVNVFLMPWAGATWLANGRGHARQDWRNASFVLASLSFAGAVANIAWLVPAGKSLHDYKQRTGEWMTVRRARTNLGFTSVDTAFRISGMIGGAIAMSRDNRGPGYVLLIPNAIVLPFHIWALCATSRELKSRKRETSSERAPRVQPTGSGFRF